MDPIKTDLEIDYKFYDLYSPELSHLRNDLNKAADRILHGVLKGPLNAWVFEMAVNALKATYKRVYRISLLEPVGLDDISYEKWLQLFRTEIDEHSAENFAHYCRENDISVHVRGGFENDIFRIDVINPGVPGEEEQERISLAIERARSLTDLDSLFDGSLLDEESDDPRKEGGGIGLSLIFMGLRGLGFDLECFRVFTDGEQTISRIELPVRLDQERQDHTVRFITDSDEIRSLLDEFQQENKLYLIQFDTEGMIRALSPEILKTLGHTEGDIEAFSQSIPEKFIQEVFHSSRGLRVVNSFNNYRIFLHSGDGSHRILFNVSGHLSQTGFVNTLWQEVVRGNSHQLSEGSFSGNIQLHNIIEPYIPSLILQKAREVIQTGQSKIPDEVTDRTVVFADLEGFTRKAESMEPLLVIELLNLVFGVMVQSIRRNGGYVDKFMGDAIMATFPDPLGAVVASIEIQNQFHQLNQFRRLSGAVPIHLRIGINSGVVIMGNIGTKEIKDWTPLGDVVNTASRIEKSSEPGCVHVSEHTFKRIKDRVEVDRIYKIRVKGKEEILKVYSIDKVSFSSNNIPMSMRLKKEQIVDPSLEELPDENDSRTNHS